MNESLIIISPWGYAAVTGLGLISAAMVQVYAKSHGLKVVWAQIRMTLQLVLMGFVLVAIFDHPHPVVSLLAIAVMETFAVLTVVGQHRGSVSRRALLTAGAGLVVGSVISCALFVTTVVGINPLVNPRYLLPLLGMIVGNSMTAINLAVRYMASQVKSQKTMVETVLHLGGTKNYAVAPIAKEAFLSALTPTITTMLSLGIVMLPGMMTGQILSGSVPLVAVGYQLSIMVGILFSVVLSTWFTLQFGGRYFLDEIPD